jgi:hypothetical protein
MRERPREAWDARASSGNFFWHDRRRLSLPLPEGRGAVKLAPLRRRSRGERAPVKLGALYRRSRRGRGQETKAKKVV